MTGTVIWWLRRDLRLQHNPLLEAAAKRAVRLAAVFVIDPRLLRSPYHSPRREAFLWDGLRALENDLRKMGGRLIVRRGLPEDELPRLARELGALAVWAQPDVSPYSARRDRRVEAALQGVAALEWWGSPAVRPAGTVVKADGSPYTVFTPFSKAWKAAPGLPQRGTQPGPLPEFDPADQVGGLDIPQARPAANFPAGETEAQRRLGDFLAGPVYAYDARRDRMDLDGTAALSPYLRFGMLSPAQAVAGATTAIEAVAGDERRSAETWLNELIWREFYIHILHHFPQVRQGNFRSMQVRWRNDPAEFAAWCEGRTGVPVVDAAMRQLVQTGWMHNRARMITASFLTKDLLIDWRWGERFFMQHLIDGDPAANNGGWQWTAGTGTDAAPYFRIFNPVTQSLKFDPQGDYIRRWVTELAGVQGADVHQPWKMERPPADYPTPIVEHGEARKRALEGYQKGG